MDEDETCTDSNCSTCSTDPELSLLSGRNVNTLQWNGIDEMDVTDVEALSEDRYSKAITQTEDQIHVNGVRSVSSSVVLIDNDPSSTLLNSPGSPTPSIKQVNQLTTADAIFRELQNSSSNQETPQKGLKIEEEWNMKGSGKNIFNDSSSFRMTKHVETSAHENLSGKLGLGDLQDSDNASSSASTDLSPFSDNTSPKPRNQDTSATHAYKPAEYHSYPGDGRRASGFAKPKKCPKGWKDLPELVVPSYTTSKTPEAFNEDLLLQIGTCDMSPIDSESSGSTTNSNLEWF